MNRIKHGTVTALLLTAVGFISIAAILGVRAFDSQDIVLPIHARPDVCITQIMLSRTIGDSGFGDWRQHYVEEKSKKASGDYVKRTTTSEGKIEIWVAENGEARQYWLNSKAAATSRPFKASNVFYDESWLAASKDLRKENPVVEVLGHKTYVLRHDTGSGYVDNYIAPDIGEVVMVYRHTIRSNGVLESLILPVSIQLNQLNQELWDSIPRGTPVTRLKRP